MRIITWLLLAVLIEGALVYLPLGGSMQTTALYYTNIQIDNTTYRVAIDSGSSALLIPSQPTALSGAHYRIEDAIRLEIPTCVPCLEKQCCFRFAFLDETTGKAVAISANVTLGNITSFAQLGVAVTPLVLGHGQIDGILGMGYQTGPRLVPVMDSFDVHTFSICLNDFGGLLILGGVDSTLNMYGVEPLFTPQVAPNRFAVSTTITVGKRPQPVVIDLVASVDTGTSLLLLPVAVHQLLVAEMKAEGCLKGFCSEGWQQKTIFDASTCMELSLEDIQVYPTIHFEYPGEDQPFSLPLVPAQYMIPMNSTGGKPCRYFGIRPLKTDEAILGQLFLNKLTTVFDKNRSRLGFAEANVSRCQFDIPLLAIPNQAHYFWEASCTIIVMILAYLGVRAAGSARVGK